MILPTDYQNRASQLNRAGQQMLEQFGPIVRIQSVELRPRPLQIFFAPMNVKKWRRTFIIEQKKIE